LTLSCNQKPLEANQIDFLAFFSTRPFRQVINGVWTDSRDFLFGPEAY
jgi:hypothetical protein